MCETVESCVEPATSARQNTIKQHRRLGKRCDHHLAAGADAAETGADVHPCEREEEARASQQRDDGDQIGGPVEQQPGRKGRHQGGGNPDRREGDVGRHAEQPRRVVGQHHFLAQQPQQVAIGLKDRGPLAAHQPGLDLAHVAGQQRGEQQHEQHLHALHDDVRDHDHIASTSSRVTRVAKTRLRYCRMVRNCRRLSRVDRKPTASAIGA